MPRIGVKGAMRPTPGMFIEVCYSLSPEELVSRVHSKIGLHPFSIRIRLCIPMDVGLLLHATLGL